MNSALCTEKHLTVDKRLDNAEESICKHNEKIEKIEIDNVKIFQDLTNLIAILKWILGLATGITGKFLYEYLLTILK